MLRNQLISIINHSWEFAIVRQGLGSEHPLWGRIQLLMLILFFAVWAIDTLSFFTFDYSTVIYEALAFPVLFAGSLLFFCLSFCLVLKSHKVVLEQVREKPELVDSGVCGWVRHPMYLGTLLFAYLFFSLAVHLPQL